jgi:hypothetical protein
MEHHDVMNWLALAQRAWQGQFVWWEGFRNRGRIVEPEETVVSDPVSGLTDRVSCRAWRRRPAKRFLAGWANVGDAQRGISDTDEGGQIVHCRLPARSLIIRIPLGRLDGDMKPRRLDGERRVGREEPNAFQFIRAKALDIARFLQDKHTQRDAIRREQRHTQERGSW